jgi:predicted glycoside hydrolase/deacetylase ChbG (UPF0249 family)
MRLLLNADDLGYTPLINRTIFDLHDRSRLTSASLLVNLPHTQDAIQGLHVRPGLGVGVHLNLTKGCPLLPPEQTPSLVNAAGEFWPTKQFFLLAAISRINIREVEAELRAQIECVMDFGITPTHLDSHSHWHLLPHLRDLIAVLAEGYRIPGMRQAAPRRTLLPSRLWLKLISRKALRQSPLLHPDYLLSLHQWMGTKGQPHALFFDEQLHQRLARPEITLELVTHPGVLHDPDFPPDTLLTHQRQWEVDFLLSPGFAVWLEMMEAEIVNYRARSQFAK